MNLKLKAPQLAAHDKFVLQLIDSNTGVTKQVAEAYNVVNSSRYVMGAIANTWPGQSTHSNAVRVFSRMYLGTGTGTPSSDDSSLFTLAFGSTDLTWTRQNDFNYTQMAYKTEYTFPATTSYVGILTEIGLAAYDSRSLLSHALLVDAEGNPITITKTSTDILIITAYLYFDIILTAQILGMKYFPAYAALLCGAVANNVSYATTMGGVIPPLPYTYGFGFSGAFTSSDAAGILHYPIAATQGSYATFTKAASDGYLFPIRYTATNVRANQTEKNFGFAHSIVIDGLGAIPLPNADIIPPYGYTGIAVGTGDGTSTSFYTPINETTDVTVLVDGVEDPDATFTNFDVKQSPLWNKCIRVDVHDRDGLITESLIPGGYTLDSNNYGTNFGHIAMTDMTVGNTSTPVPRHWQSLYVGMMPVYADTNGITLDHIRVGCAWVSPYNSYWVAITAVLEYSTDGITWTTAATCTAPGTLYFTPITAPYWRLKNGYYSWASNTCTRENMMSDTRNRNGYCAYDPCALVAGNSAVYDFGKVGINFDTAPASGAIITMDAILNLPYKSPDTISIVSLEVQAPDPMV